MGENLQSVIPGLNKPLRIESQTDRLTSDLGGVLLREIMEASSIVTSVGDRYPRYLAAD